MNECRGGEGEGEVREMTSKVRGGFMGWEAQEVSVEVSSQALLSSLVLLSYPTNGLEVSVGCNCV